MANLSRLEGELKPQALRILEMLRAAPERGVSNGDFIRSYIERFGGRICEMRKLGWQIETVREGQGKSRYFLRAEPGEQPRSGEAWEPSDICQCGCEKPIHRAGARYLPGHYDRQDTVEYAVDPLSGCWVWQRNLYANGYGKRTVRRPDGSKGAELAHRHYYEKHVGAIPEGLHIDHLCRNRACVNPDHLEPVTAAENNRRCPAVKLSPDQVREIRSSDQPAAKMAKRFGVNSRSIYAIRNGKKWADLPQEPAGSSAGAHMVTTRQRASTGPGGLRMRRPKDSDAVAGLGGPMCPGGGSLFSTNEQSSMYDPWSEVA